ncbi:MAG: enamine deaminase RidA [SAR86 cluster bacterium]|uniref:Enamine deaminase RidA n=1 Tax=SAR86 cluster bacterium TaxID=2030880 RepID=A0A2A5CJ03_9GAMM|nr:RidA family protein [Gammaproteobacteria bacterium AH-315-E17]PCJ43485.1 MAG: enamine deaminase RidA [SAR86 cluster bacterium]
MREALISTQLTAPLFRYSQLIKAGPNYVCSGMIALDNETGKLIEGDSGEQARKIFQNLNILIQEFSLSLGDLVSVRIFSRKFDQFPLINQAWEEVFTVDKVPPARAAVGVSALPLNALVEIEFSFYKT